MCVRSANRHRANECFAGKPDIIQSSLPSDLESTQSLRYEQLQVKKIEPGLLQREKGNRRQLLEK